MKPKLARIYKRRFNSTFDVNEFIKATELIKDRLIAVDVKYRLYQCTEDPFVIFELWEYPDAEAMEWVQSSMEGAVSNPRKFDIDSEIFTLAVKTAIDIEE